MFTDAHQWLDAIHQLALPYEAGSKKIKILNVCGGHERSIAMAGLRKVLPESIELIPGPGCPVCVCPEEDLYSAIQLALNEKLILLAFGDMLRVPVNVKKNEARTLQQAKSMGADIRPLASPSDAVRIAKENPHKQVVFFAAGFETTMAPIAAMVLQGMPQNLSLLLSGRLTWPAVAMLLKSGEADFDALIAPGHVSTIMGPEEWQFVVDEYQIATAVAGFTTESLLAAIYSTLRQTKEKHFFLDNCYPEVVHNAGNRTAQAQLFEVMQVYSANWRGIGQIEASGFKLNENFADHDARKRFTEYTDETRTRVGEMPAGCDCAQVVLGRLYPDQCRLYGTACVPAHPIGPCMVSDEGACRIWWASGLTSRTTQQHEPLPT